MLPSTKETLLEEGITSMVNPDPDQRPTMEQVVAQSQKLVSKVPGWRLRSRVIPREECFLVGIADSIYHIYRTIPNILRWRKAIPTPKAPTT